MCQTKEPADEFRRPESMSVPDIRWSFYKVLDPEAGTARPVTSDDHYRLICQFDLSEEVPTNIRIQWDAARNLWLYSWHVWRFQESAEMRAYSTFEMALRLRLGAQSKRDRGGLKVLMLKAIRDELLKDHAIEYYRSRNKLANRISPDIDAVRDNYLEADEIDKDSQHYCLILAECFPKLRNGYAHGSESCGHSPVLTFSLCRDLINQLWVSTKDDTSG